MPSRSGTSPARLGLAVVAALLIHALLGGYLVLAGVLESLLPRYQVAGVGTGTLAPVATDEDRPIEVESLVDELRRDDERTPEEQRAEAERRKEAEEKDPHGQVVDIERPALEQRPEDARFAAEYDSSVAHETRGKAGLHAGALRAAPASEPARPAVPPSGSPLARPGMPGERRADGHAAPRLPGDNGVAREVGPGGDSRRPGARATPNHARKSPGLGEGGVPGLPGAPHPDLQPSDEMLTRAIGSGTGSPDYLKDIDDGESTALNAKKFKYASFFNRVKRAVAEEWHPDVIYLRHDPSGNVYGLKDRVTVVRVHLRPDGTLREPITLLQSSGVGFLDDEGIEAFRRAQPFVNPPPQLVDSDGLIHFNFGFIFELSGHTSFKVLRE